MKKHLFLIFALCLFTITVFAQGAGTTSQQSFQMFQGHGVYDDAMMDLLTGLRTFMWDSWSDFIEDAKALSAIFMIIFFAIKSYEMMSGDKKLEIMPLLRPFGLALLILWWGAITKMVAFPTDLIQQQASTKWQDEQKVADNLRIQRAGLVQEMADSLIAYQSQTEVASKESDTWYNEAWNTVTSPVKQGISTIVAPIKELRARFQVGLQLLMTQLLELLAVWLLRIGTYFVFLLQVIYSSVLIILGPFSVAVSILPAFRDSFTTWIARFIAVNLYGTIAYLIMWINACIQQYAMGAEISRYTAILHGGAAANRMAELAIFTGNGVLSFGTVIVTFVIGALAMFTVPSISTWIVSTSGISSAASTFGRNASQMLSNAKKLL